MSPTSISCLKSKGVTFVALSILLVVGMPVAAPSASTSPSGAISGAANAIPAPGSKLPATDGPKVITAADVTAEKVGSSIPVSAIGEPVGAVTLSAPRWVDDANGGYGVVDGQILPVDPKGKPINFRVSLPAKWQRRGLQLGGGGMNGSVPGVTNANDLARGFAMYGSDSGHQQGGGGGIPGGGPPGGGRGGAPGGAFPGGAGKGLATRPALHLRRCHAPGRKALPSGRGVGAGTPGSLDGPAGRCDGAGAVARGCGDCRELVS